MQLRDEHAERLVQWLDLPREQHFGVERLAGRGRRAERAPVGAIARDCELGKQFGLAGVHAEAVLDGTPTGDDGPDEVVFVGDAEIRDERPQAREVVRALLIQVVAMRTAMPASTSFSTALTTLAKFSGPRIVSFAIGSAESSEI